MLEVDFDPNFTLLDHLISYFSLHTYLLSYLLFYLNQRKIPNKGVRYVGPRLFSYRQSSVEIMVSTVVWHFGVLGQGVGKVCQGMCLQQCNILVCQGVGKVRYAGAGVTYGSRGGFQRFKSSFRSFRCVYNGYMCVDLCVSTDTKLFGVYCTRRRS